jgi:hypothetical protein
MVDNLTNEKNVSAQVHELLCLRTHRGLAAILAVIGIIGALPPWRSESPMRPMSSLELLSTPILILALVGGVFVVRCFGERLIVLLMASSVMMKFVVRLPTFHFQNPQAITRPVSSAIWATVAAISIAYLIVKRNRPVQRGENALQD